MPNYFNFKRLINKYSVEFKVIIPSQEWDEENFEYKKGRTTEKIMTGAIINFTESKRYKYEGVITEKDMRLFTNNPLSNELVSSYVIYQGNKYKIEQSTENSNFTGVYSYILRWVDIFSGSGGDSID